MTTLQKQLSFIGLSKQTAKGSGASSPATFGFGILDGKVFQAPITQDYEDQTLPGGASDRFAVGVNRTRVLPGANFKARAHARAIGLLGLGALGADAPTGAGPYTHAETPALDLPYLTLFSKFATGDYEKSIDCKVGKLGFSWAETDPVEVDVELIACTPTIGAGGAWTFTTDESIANNYHGPNAGVFQLDVDGTTLAVEAVTGFSCEIDNNLDPVFLSKSVLPDDIEEGEQVVEGSVTLKPGDLDEWRAILTGTPAGTTVRETPVYGSLSMKCVLDASNEITWAANRVAFLTDFPDSDVGGGAGEVELAYQVVRPLDGSAAFTLTVKNTTATY